MRGGQPGSSQGGESATERSHDPLKSAFDAGCMQQTPHACKEEEHGEGHAWWNFLNEDVLRMVGTVSVRWGHGEEMSTKVCTSVDER